MATSQTFIVCRSALAARMRAEEYVRTVVVLVHCGVAVLPGAARRTTCARSFAAALAAAAHRLLLLEILTEHQIHRAAVIKPIQPETKATNPPYVHKERADSPTNSNSPSTHLYTC